VSGGARRITQLSIRFDDRSGHPVEEGTVDLDDRSISADGQAVAVPDIAASISITITAVGGGQPFTAGAVAGVGFSEIALGLPVGREVVRVPTDALDSVGATTPLAYAFTRWRVDPMDRWRDDPERTLARSFGVPGQRTFTPTVDVRVDARASDADLAALFDWPVAASTRLTGSLATVGAAAFDGDPGTAWVTAFGASAGAVLTVDDTGRELAGITIDQPVGDFSQVVSVRLSVGDEHRIVPLSPTGATTAVLDPPLPRGRLDITLAEVTSATTVDRRFADPVELPAAIAEITFDGAPRVDLGAAPVLECLPLAEIDGVPVAATVDLAGWRERALLGTPLDTTVCTEPVTLTGDAMLTATDLDVPLQLDRVVLDDGARDALDAAGDAGSEARVTAVTGGRFERTVSVSGCADGCWLVYGEGFNSGWSARATGDGPLAGPVLIDGGFNGWWLAPGTEQVTVTWGPQRAQDLALLASLAVALAAVALVVLDRRAARAAEVAVAPAAAPALAWERVPSGRPGWLIVALWTLPALLLAGPVWALLGLVGGLAAQRYRSVPLAALTTLATVAVIGVAVTYLERRDAPAPGGGWPTTFSSLHWVGMFAFAVLATSVLLDDE
jgi:arabinofuranan 3-O-arabinosyltransferase